jgi:hypothetical protein
MALNDVGSGLLDISFKEITDLNFNVSDGNASASNKITRNDESSLLFEFNAKVGSFAIDSHFYSNKSCTIPVKSEDDLSLSVYQKTKEEKGEGEGDGAFGGIDRTTTDEPFNRFSTGNYIRSITTKKD